jgi:hypothetical protein
MNPPARLSFNPSRPPPQEGHVRDFESDSGSNPSLGKGVAVLSASVAVVAAITCSFAFNASSCYRHARCS